MKFSAFLTIIFTLAFSAFAQTNDLSVKGEKHFKNIKQLTFGGENAEAYFSFDGKKLIFQSKRDELKCDQIFTMNIDGSNVKMISNGEGRTTWFVFYERRQKSSLRFDARRRQGMSAAPPILPKVNVRAVYP